MAKVMVRTMVEGTIDKYDAFRALCEDLDLKMLTQDNLSDYKVEEGVLCRYVDISYHGSPKYVKEKVSDDYRTVTLFENLLMVKSLLG